jgi:endogenous inhibitor of DNA gyrase (YacG/DUF329 family)
MAEARCPLCRKPSQPAFKPFCSQGCRDRDLLAWLGEGYRIPVPDNGEEQESGLDSEG